MLPDIPDEGGHMADPTFDADVKPLFREKDRDAMLHRFDLWSLEDVRANAVPILGAVRAGSMPCDGGWDASKVDVFERWANNGMSE
jgi:hypothetical protein